MTLIIHGGRACAVATNAGVISAPEVSALEPDHPRRRFIGALCLYARDVRVGAVPGPYDAEGRLLRARCSSRTSSSSRSPGSPTQRSPSTSTSRSSRCASSGRTHRAGPARASNAARHAAVRGGRIGRARPLLQVWRRSRVRRTRSIRERKAAVGLRCAERTHRRAVSSGGRLRRPLPPPSAGSVRPVEVRPRSVSSVRSRAIGSVAGGPRRTPVLLRCATDC